MDKNGRVLDLQISRLGASWRPLGPISIFWGRSWGVSWDRPSAVRVPPEAFPERFGDYFSVLFVMMIIYITKSVFLKNTRFMLVKRTILKIHTPSFCILGHIFCPRTMHAAAFQSRSIHVHLGNATRHILDPLRDGLLSAKIPPKSRF